MQHSTAEYLAAAIADMRQTEQHIIGKLAPLIEAAASVDADTRELQRDLDMGGKGLQTAQDALSDSTVALALGETTEAAHRLCVDAVTAAQKIVSKIAPKAIEVASKTDAARKLSQRIAPLDAELVALRGKLADAIKAEKVATLKGELSSEVPIYSRHAEAMMRSLALCMARHQALVELGYSPELLNPGVSSTQAGSFNGFPLSGNVGEMVQAERIRIAAALRA